MQTYCGQLGPNSPGDPLLLESLLHTPLKESFEIHSDELKEILVEMSRSHKDREIFPEFFLMKRIAVPHHFFFHSRDYFRKWPKVLQKLSSNMSQSWGSSPQVTAAPLWGCSARGVFYPGVFNTFSAKTCTCGLRLASCSDATLM
jgi:hypothetical protein